MERNAHRRNAQQQFLRMFKSLGPDSGFRLDNRPRGCGQSFSRLLDSSMLRSSAKDHTPLHAQPQGHHILGAMLGNFRIRRRHRRIQRSAQRGGSTTIISACTRADKAPFANTGVLSKFASAWCGFALVPHLSAPRIFPPHTVKSYRQHGRARTLIWTRSRDEVCDIVVQQREGIFRDMKVKAQVTFTASHEWVDFM